MTNRNPNLHNGASKISNLSLTTQNGYYGQILAHNGTRFAPATNDSGLVLLKTQNIGFNVASVTVTWVFDSSYDNYRVSWSGMDVSHVGYSCYLRLNNSPSNTYKYGGIYHNYGAGIGDAYENPTGACWLGIMSNKMSGFIDLSRVTTSSSTNWVVSSSGNDYSNYAGGVDTNIAQHSGFTILPATGIIAGGTIRVYGYRN